MLSASLRSFKSRRTRSQSRSRDPEWVVTVTRPYKSGLLEVRAVQRSSGKAGGSAAAVRFLASVSGAQSPERRAEEPPCSQRDPRPALAARDCFGGRARRACTLAVHFLPTLPPAGERVLGCVSDDLSGACKGLDVEMLTDAGFCLGSGQHARTCLAKTQVLRRGPHPDLPRRRRVQLGLPAHERHQLRVQ